MMKQSQASSQYALFEHQLLKLPCCRSAVFTYLSYLCILQDLRLCRVLSFSLKLNSSFYSFTEEWLACLLVNAHPLSRRRLQLTIVGFHHHRECTALLVMACQRIFFTPLSLCLSFLPSSGPPLHIGVPCSGYGLLYCQTHSPHHVPGHIYFHLDEANVNSNRTFAIITLGAYRLQKLNR